MRVPRILLGCVVATAAMQAAAQTPYQTPAPYQEVQVFKRFEWNFGGMLLVPVGPSSDRSREGGGFTAGFTYNFQPVIGAQFEYALGLNTLKSSSALQQQGIGGNGVLQYFNLNLVLHPVHSGAVGFYLIAGGGYYYRRVDVTQVQGTAVAPYCDPWLLYCSAVPVSVSSVIGSRTSWDWGADAGLGLTFGAPTHVQFYMEARYHYIWGPDFVGPTGQHTAANGQFVPIVLGARF
jgi:hypothetical protein